MGKDARLGVDIMRKICYFVLLIRSEKKYESGT